MGAEVNIEYTGLIEALNAMMSASNVRPFTRCVVRARRCKA